MCESPGSAWHVWRQRLVLTTLNWSRSRCGWFTKGCTPASTRARRCGRRRSPSSRTWWPRPAIHPRQLPDRRRRLRAGAPCSVDGPLMVHPIRLAEFELENLSGRVARQLVHELDPSRALVASQPLAAASDDVRSTELDASVPHDEGERGLAPAVVRYADDRGVAHAVDTEEDVLDLPGVDVLPARNDHVF